MRKLRVYIDTSVIGGCFDEEFSEWSNKLFDEFIEGKRIAVISDIVFDELVNAPEIVKNKVKEIPKRLVEILHRNEEVLALADLYIKNDAISQKYSDDALHIAFATIFRADVLVSWNFRHIVNLRRIRIYNGINITEGYSLIEIRSPREVLEYEE